MYNSLSLRRSLVWCEELEKLTTIADTQPHVAYAALTCGLVSIPDINSILELTLRTKFIPALTGRPPPNDQERNLFALPTCLGVLGLMNPVKRSAMEFTASQRTLESLYYPADP